METLKMEPALIDRPVYLDNNATTRTDPSVVEAMLPFFTEQFGNPSSSHDFGVHVAGAVGKARASLQSLLGASSPREIIFTSGGSESDNTALLSAFELGGLAGEPGKRNEIITTAVEHPALLAYAAYLQETRGAKVIHIGVDGRGRLDMAALRAALGPRTALVSVMWANNETGTILPVADIAEMAHGEGALFHTDAVQAVGKVKIDLAGTSIDMLSLSGHKFHGPKGIGALYLRDGIRLRPLIRGGRQERGRRAGTENVPGIVGLGRAAVLAAENLAVEQSQVRALRDRLQEGILANIPYCAALGDGDNRLPNTLNVAFDCLDSEAILHKLQKAGIAVSSGSACASGSMEPSHVLRAMHLPPTSLQGAIRFSLSRETTNADVDRVLAILPEIIAQLQGRSPLLRERILGSVAVA